MTPQQQKEAEELLRLQAELFKFYHRPVPDSLEKVKASMVNDLCQVFAIDTSNFKDMVTDYNNRLDRMIEVTPFG